MQTNHSLKLKALGIDTYKEAVIYMRKDCQVCRSEGFDVHARILVTLGKKNILATLNTIEDGLLTTDEVSLSTYAWKLLNAKEGDIVHLSHPQPLESLDFIRSKIHGRTLDDYKIDTIIQDIVTGRYSDIHIASFLTACAGNHLSETEITGLARAMINVGERLSWNNEIIVDKHSAGGLPGNRTTPIIVPIVTAFGLTMPKTSSRAITSPAGTADTMETLAPVELSVANMKRVVEKEGGCIVWGGTVNLSPADDILIRVERVMNLDDEGQLVASVLSKKIAAGSNHILLDIPVGLTAKIPNIHIAARLEHLFQIVAQALNVKLAIKISDGSQPIGYGIGPALEAKDILTVLQNKKGAPLDLRDKALELAGMILEFSPAVKKGEGLSIATKLLDDGAAWKKFQAICDAQGGLREPPTAPFSHTIEAMQNGQVVNMNNQKIAKIAKLAGAPHDKAAGIFLQTKLNRFVERGHPLFTIYAESKGALKYALKMLEQTSEVIQIK